MLNNAALCLILLEILCPEYSFGDDSAWEKYYFRKDLTNLGIYIRIYTNIYQT